MKTGDRKTDRKKRQTGRIQWMKIYLAPLEGITGHIYRTALKECFDGFDKYFIPFISPNQKGHFSTREKKDVLPENNRGVLAVPQILTNQAEDFIETAKKLAEYGYEEVNLNLGCPSRTLLRRPFRRRRRKSRLRRFPAAPGPGSAAGPSGTDTSTAASPAAVRCLRDTRA